MELGWWDLVVCVAALVASALIGVFFACRSKGGAGEYLRGDHSMSIAPVVLSLVASFVSGVTLLGLPAEIYRDGSQFMVCLPAIFLMGATITCVLLPVYRDLQLDTCYQYLEMRFDHRVRTVASMLFVINQVLFIPIVIYVPALALSQVTGADLFFSTILTSLVCIFYTTFGGLRAVVWTDALQTVLMVGAQLAVIVLGVRKVGGLSQMWELCEQGHRLELFDLDPSPLKRHTLWTVFIGGYVMYLAQCGVGQGFVQRYMAVPSLRAAKWTLFWFTLGLAFVVGISGFTGLVAYAAYHDCDPITSGRMSRPDQLVPLFLLDVAKDVPGLPGLYVAGVLSAALSSMSTGMNAVCGVLVEDLLAGKLSQRLSQGVWLRLISALTGLLCLSLALLVEKLGGVLQATISMNGVTTGALLGLFLLGLFVPRATSRAALAGSVTSLTLMGTLVALTQAAVWRGEIVQQLLPVSVSGCSTEVHVPLEEVRSDSESWSVLQISYMYYALMGALLVQVVALPVSLLLPKKAAFLPPAQLLHPWARRWLPSSQHQHGKNLVTMVSAPQEQVPLVTLKPRD